MSTTTLKPPTFVNAGPMRVVGLQQHYEYKDCGSIPQLWQRFGPNFRELAPKAGGVAYGLCFNADEKGLDYMCGVDLVDPADVVGDLTIKDIPAQRYAVFEHEGHVSKFGETQMAVLHEWLPGSGEVPVDSAVVIEWYGADFDPAVGYGHMQLWFPVRS